MTNIIASDDRSTSFPQLAGKIVKSAMTKSVVPFLAELVAEYDRGSPFQRHRKKAAEWLSVFYRTLDEAGLFLTDGELNVLRYAVIRSLDHLWTHGCRGRTKRTTTKYIHLIVHRSVQHT